MGFLRSLNKLAVPFLSDEGVGEDDYALLPPPQPLGLLQLTAITFFAVSGSAYGIEETVSSAGPLLALTGLAGAVLCWSGPLAMVSAELSVALPHSGGYVIWVNTAFGPVASLINGMTNLVCNVFDCALYPLLLSQYLERALLPLLPPEPHGGSEAGWIRLVPDLIGTTLRMLLVALAAVINVLGTNVVGVGAGVLMLLVSVPIIALTIAAYQAPSSEPLRPFDPAEQNLPSSYAEGYFFTTLLLWNTCGYDSAGMVAAEVVDGRSIYPRALTAAVILTTLSYALPLAACASADHDWSHWRSGHFELLGKEFGGEPLGIALLCASVVSMVGVMCTLVCTTSRALVAMSQLRMLPAALSRLHPQTGTPWLAVLTNSAMIAIATVFLRFEALLELTMFFYAANAIVQCAALLRLRSTHPHRLRPRHIIPAPLLLLPIVTSTVILVGSPLRNWLGAATTVGATCVLYALINLGRLSAGYKLSDPPSARAAAAAEALAVAVPPYQGSVDDPAHGDGDATNHPTEVSGSGASGVGQAGQGRQGSGDAWFGKLVASYRRVPDREQQAAEAVQAFEMTEIESGHEERDYGDESIEAVRELEGRQVARAMHDAHEVLPAALGGGGRGSSGERAQAGVAMQGVAAPQVLAARSSSRGEEVSASEAAGALVAERASRSGGAAAQEPSELDGYVDIIE